MNQGLAEAPVRPGASALRVGAALGGVVLAAVVVFSLGVMVGKRVAESVPVVAAPPAALPTETVPPLPAAAPGPEGAIPPEKLTFYDRLSGVATPAPVALPQGEAPPQAVAAEQPPARTTPPRAENPRKAATKSAAAPPKAAPPARVDPDAGIRKLVGKGNFTVQVASLTDRAAAEETAARLRRQNFEVLTVMASVKGKTWYRIRVGSFPNKQAATKAAGIFRSAYGLDAVAVRE